MYVHIYNPQKMRQKTLLFLFLNTVTLSIAYPQKPVEVIPLPDKTGFTVNSETKDLGNGFFDHGVASPISNHRGVACTVDADGRNVVLVWLFDHRGGYALLMIDAETGKSEEFKMPFDPKHDTPYSSVLSKDNKFYTLFRGTFTEFDPIKRAFTYTAETMPQIGMALTEDDDGKIWAVTYPNSGLVSFDPKTRELKDYKSVNKENYRQYQKTIAADDAGWIYFGLGNVLSQIFAFNPETGSIQGMLPESERKAGMAMVYRDLNGKVYGKPLKTIDNEWYELYKGKGRKIGNYTNRNPKPINSPDAWDNNFNYAFPDGSILKNLDLVNRKITVEDGKTKAVKSVSFNYTSDGAIVMGIGAAPDGTIVGGTAFPMRFFNYDIKKDRWTNRQSVGEFGQLNAVTTQGNKVFFGVYPNGNLIEWDPNKPWVRGEENNKSSNPLMLATVSPTIIRPFRVVGHPDGKTIIMGGTPEYGATGGGLLFWDNETKTKTLLKDTEVVKNQTSMSLVPMPNGLLLGGTTTTPGSGGEKKASEAVMYLMNMSTKKVVWQKAVFPGVQEYSEMRLVPNGLVYGITDKNRFFVFDPAKKAVIHEEDLMKSYGRTTAEQSPRIFVTGPQNEMYILFANGSIVQIDPKTYKLNLIAKSPGPIKAGGDYANGRIYFVSGSHLYSYKL